MVFRISGLLGEIELRVDLWGSGQGFSVPGSGHLGIYDQVGSLQRPTNRFASLADDIEVQEGLCPWF